MAPSARSLLRGLHLVLLRIHRACLRRPKMVLLTTFLFTLIALAGATRLQMLVSIDDLVDADFETYSDLAALNSHFDDIGSLYALVTTKSGEPPTAKELCAVRKWIFDVADTSGIVSNITSSFGASRVFSSASEFRFQSLLDPDCGTHHPQKSTLTQAFNSLAESPWGPLLTSKNRNDIILNLLVRRPENAGQYGSINAEGVEALLQSFDSSVTASNSNVEVWWSGVAFFEASLKRGYELTGFVNLIMFLLVFVMFRAIFGTWKSGALFLLPFITALIWTYGAMGYFNAPIDVLSNALGLLVLVASIEDFLFICYLQKKSPRAHWRRAFRQLLVPSFFTSLTTIVGFGSLVAGRLDIISRFGLWAAFAALVEWILVFLFLPAFLTVFPRSSSFVSSSHSSLVNWAERLKVFRIPRRLAFASLALYFVAAFGVNRLYVQDAPHKIFNPDHPFRKAMSYIKDSRGWITEVSLVFNDPLDDTFNRSILDRVTKDPDISGVESPMAVKDYLSEGLPTHRAALARELYELSPFSSRLISSKGDVSRAILYLADTDIVRVNSLRSKVQELCGEKCFLAGTLVSYGEFGQRVLSTFLSSLSLSLVLVLCVLAFLIRALGQKNGWALLLSALWGPMILLAGFACLAIPISYITSVFASILVGLAGDNAIQYLFANSRSRSDRSFQNIGGASILVSVVMLVATCSLFVSIFAPMKTLGLLLLCGFILNTLGDYWILNSLTEHKQTSVQEHS